MTPKEMENIDAAAEAMRIEIGYEGTTEQMLIDSMCCFAGRYVTVVLERAQRGMKVPILK